MEWLKPGKSMVNLTLVTTPKMEMQCPNPEFMVAGMISAATQILELPRCNRMALATTLASKSVKAVVMAMGPQTHPNPPPRYQNNSGVMGHGFGNHRNYERTEAYGNDEANDHWECGNNGMARSQPHHRGKHSGHGNRFGKKLGFEFTEAETYEYRETHFSNESQYYIGARGYHGGNDHSIKGMPRKMKDGYSGNNSCSDSESDNEDDDYGFRKDWISRAI